MEINVANREEFRELQTKLMESNRLRDEVAARANQANREGNKCQLTLRALDEAVAADSNTRAFVGVGRMFLHTPVPDIQERLKNKTSQCQKETESLKKQHEHICKKVEEAENSIREIMMQSYKQSQA
eukprot:CAMPEP_0114630084 /NCGR_PEP_ID=MMETSP0168-20121206/13699_1 /TAXON_ID=95228 ORGANISM="Vannella sp., Strain DIVA3 517/6/12" /NCGR_SAMPLE_ID=MMETSP0168 /ASSEMBLY_ACC=CAM_ASM_000044 /LENGTH=126 /DNA_ID=CAMNT_0001841577 /DNA_START=22 /DNA_END=398 /DNA_ORIENTATION=+